jgi:hypothetical protein
MLTRALFVLMLMCGMTASAAWAQETTLVVLGLTDHEATQEELDKGAKLPVPHFNTAGVAYVLVANVKKGDTVEITLNNGDTPLLRNTETLAEDKVSLLLQAGKRGVPAGGWPEGAYHAEVKIIRDGKPIIEETSKPMTFE